MKTEDITLLLDKFYRGETSLNEERYLNDFFCQENIPSELERDRNVFLSLAGNDVPVPDKLEWTITSLIDSLDKEEVQKPPRRTILKMRYSLVAVAASLMLLMGIGFFYQQQQKADMPADTYNNPDEAYRATMDALQLFSENFSKGIKPMERAEARIEETKQIVNKSINK